jgi:DNA-binding NtrC family response regulator
MVKPGIRQILVLDDEPNIVSAVQRELNSPPFGRYHYKVEGFTNPLRALERVREHMFDAIISDYRMPGMDGLEFLKVLAEIQPDCARLVLSGQTDLDALVRMVNATHIYRFIAKPWDDYHLKASLAQALDYSSALIENRRLAALIRKSDLLAMAVPERETDQILVVADDPAVLESLARALAQHSPVDGLFATLRAETGQTAPAVLHEEQINVQLAPSVEHALRLAERTDFSCIIADRSMPDMGGIELLERFFRLQPDCARILISSGMDKDALAAAVETAHIFAYIGKPWSDFGLRTQVALALAQRRMLRENRRLAGMASSGSHPDGG